MITVNIQIPDLNIDYNLFNFIVSKKLIKEVNNAFMGELNYNGTDIDLEKCEFIYVK